MHSIYGNNLIVGTFSEMMFLEDHELFQSTIGYAINYVEIKKWSNNNARNGEQYCKITYFIDKIKSS